MTRLAFIHHPDLGQFDYGPDHPLRVDRLDWAMELILALNLLSGPGVERITAEPVPEERLAAYHDPAYLDILRQANTGRMPYQGYNFGLGDGDNPVFPGLWDFSRLLTGASLAAAEAVVSGRAERSWSISGGMHHALKARAAGFCYLNDVVIAILRLLEERDRILYLDIDAHHGDGVQHAFYEDPRVLTISLHQVGEGFFPGAGFTSENGLGAGRGYSVNLPLPPYTDDDLWIPAFDELVPPLIEAYDPQIIVTQLGVDCLHSDPLTGLYCTDRAIEHAVKTVAATDRPWVALGGGGYDRWNVTRCWSMVTAWLQGLEPPAKLTSETAFRFEQIGGLTRPYRDEEHQVAGSTKSRNRMTIRRRLDRTKAAVFRVHGL